MTEPDTNVDVNTSESDGKNTDVAKGNEQDIKKPETKTFTQDEVNQFVKQRLAENTTKTKKDVEKLYEGKLVLTEDELTAKLNTHADTVIETYKREAAVATKRNEYKQRGLTDTQLDTITVDDIKDYDKRVNELFGALLKKEPPVLNGGSTSNNDVQTSPNQSLNDWLRADLEKTKYKNR